jgi:hypothetical protein
MRLRHSPLSFAALVLAAAGCAASAADNEHGPAYGDGGKGDATAEAGAPDGGGSPADGAARETSITDAPADSLQEASSPEASVDTGTDAPAEAANPEDAGASEGGTCSSSLAIVAGGSNSVTQSAYAHGVWSTASVASGGVAAAPVVVPFGTGYLGAVVGAGAAGDMPLESTSFTGSWIPPAAIGAALAQGVPALVVVGSTAHVVYWGSNGKFYHGTYSGSWDAASDPVQASGGPQSFGSSAPAAAAVGTTLVVLQAGQDGVLYDQTWTGSWQAATAHAGTSLVGTLSPAVVALEGGSADLLVVFVHAGDAGGYFLQYTVRTAGVWSAPSFVYDQGGNVAFAGTTPSLAALPGGKAVLAWMGSSPAYPYVSTYDPASGWTAPIAASNDTLASPPSVAPGVCGASAVLAYAKTDGTVAVTSTSGGPWTTSQLVPGTNGMAWAAVASNP